MPELSDQRRAPYEGLGAGYAALGVVILVYGYYRQRSVDRAIRTGRYVAPSESFLVGITVAGALLGLATFVMIFVS